MSALSDMNARQRAQVEEPEQAPQTVAQAIVEAIVNDLTDRRGLRQEWEEIDPDIQEEIKAEWARLAESAMRKGK